MIYRSSQTRKEREKSGGDTNNSGRIRNPIGSCDIYPEFIKLHSWWQRERFQSVCCVCMRVKYCHRFM